MSNPENNHPAFDAEDQKILDELGAAEGSATDGKAPEGGQPAAGTGTEQATQTGAQPAAAAPTDVPAATEGKPGTEAAPAASPTPAAAAPAAPGASTEPPADAQDKPQGEPRAALRAARASERRLRSELEKTRRELEDLRAGKLPVDTNISDEELERLDQDFPAVAKVVRQNKELQKQLQELTGSQHQDGGEGEFQPLEYAPEVQLVIDQVPDLLSWQYDPNAQDKFLRAVEYDKALAVDPDWKSKPAEERFAEAAKRTRQAFGMPLGDQPSSSGAKPTQSTTPAAPALDQLPVDGPKSISDFRGGAPANAPSLDYTRMSDEAIIASLRPQD